MKENIKKLSKKNWDAKGTIENINSGSFQRIADSLEVIAKDKTEMEMKIEWIKNLVGEQSKYIKNLEKSKARLKGEITKIKKKQKENKKEKPLNQSVIISDLNKIKEKIAVIQNTKDIENMADILCYDDLGAKISEVLNAVSEL